MADKINILLVEDEAITAMQMKIDLEKAGYSVHHPLATGEAAVEAVEKQSFDVILMDIGLSGKMDGVEAAERIDRISKTPIIFTTGYSDTDLRSRVDALKPAAYLVKPVSTEAISNALQHLFG